MANKYEDALVDLLKQVKEVLDRHGIIFWLDCGTLLGAVRERKFLEWENDIDLGTWNKDISEAIKESIAKELVNKGCSVGDFDTYMNIRKKTVKADLKLYRLENEKAIEPKFESANLLGSFLNYSSKALLAPYHVRVDAEAFRIKRIMQKNLIYLARMFPDLLRKGTAKSLRSFYIIFGSKDYTEYVPSRYFYNLSRIEFYGITFRVPEKTEEYLTYRYGKDWHIPRKDWLTARDDGAVLNFSAT